MHTLGTFARPGCSTSMICDHKRLVSSGTGMQPANSTRLRMFHSQTDASAAVCWS